MIVDIANDKLPFEDDSIDKIEMIDVLEHIFDLKNVMNECWRVLKKDHILYVEVPYAGSNDYYKDPTHVRPFVPDTFKYFCEWNKNPAYEIKEWITIEKHWINEHRENSDRIYCTMIPKKDV